MSDEERRAGGAGGGDDRARVRADASAPGPDRIVAETRAWIEHAVVGLHLCPFARAPLVAGRVRVACSEARDPEALLADLVDELNLLAEMPAERIETTLLVHPRVLLDFLDYNDFLAVAEGAVAALGLEGIVQLASFHPDYRFADQPADDIANATNRSPYPLLQLLREESIERALANVARPEAIFEANVETMRRLGRQGWTELQRRWRSDPAAP